jgi:NADH:ubiquinone oxidoreductase subunit 6 (subunit J)
MSIPNFIFYFFEVLAAIAAFGVLFTRNVFYGALLLIVCLLCIAGIYVLSFAEFIAVTQILVYAGGILVVILFGIMLTTKISGKPLLVESRNWFAAVVTGSFFFGLLIRLFSMETFPNTAPVEQTHANTLQTFGTLLLSDFLLPFEIAGILLLIALIGAAVTASPLNHKN